ncbi:MAG: hypothetical protein WDM96_08550 [Lacunisphaera sp.]
MPDILSGAPNPARRNFTLTLGGANTFTGGVTQNGGTIQATSNGALGLGTYTVSGNSGLYANAARTLTNALVLNGDLYAGVTGANGTNGNVITFSGTAGGTLAAGQRTITTGGNLIFANSYLLTGPGGILLKSPRQPDRRPDPRRPETRLPAASTTPARFVSRATVPWRAAPSCPARSAPARSRSTAGRCWPPRASARR